MSTADFQQDTLSSSQIIQFKENCKIILHQPFSEFEIFEPYAGRQWIQNVTWSGTPFANGWKIILTRLFYSYQQQFIRIICQLKPCLQGYYKLPPIKIESYSIILLGSLKSTPVLKKSQKLACKAEFLICFHWQAD